MRAWHVIGIVAASFVLYVVGTVMIVDRFYRRLRSAWM